MQPHIKLSENNGARTALVCGPPERAQYIAAKINNSDLLSQNREYCTFSSELNGEKIFITSHGVGSAGAAICFQELINIGVERIIRIGSAGGLQENTKIGDIILVTSAVRKDGVSDQMIPPGYPAVPDLELTYSLRKQLDNSFVPFKEGMVLSSDLFYDGLLSNEWELYKRANVVAVEMECSTLFVIGSLREVKIASMLILDGNPLKWDEGDYDSSPETLQKSLDTCIDVLKATLKETRL